VHNPIERRIFGITPGGEEVFEFTLTNINGIELKAINYGCTITSLQIPDRNGVFENIVLGFDTLEGYVQSKNYLGCVVGRCANRIAGGKFTLDGMEYVLAINNPPNHLHGGHIGLSNVVWEAEDFQNHTGIGLRFKHFSPHGHEGYPGNINLVVEYVLGDDNSLSFVYHATTDRKTILNLTQHAYFNLAAGKTNILNHELTLYADQFLPIDHNMIPTGEIRDVTNTPFDFRVSKRIGDDIHMGDPQLELANGYDHTWKLNITNENLVNATLSEPSSGRKMQVYTNEPGIQFYTGNFLEEPILGKHNTKMTKHSGLCLETQHYPDSPNHPSFPSITIDTDLPYSSKTVLRF
jgi:aldose 1-epimerase